MKLLLAAATLIALTATAQADIVCTRMGCWETVSRVTIALAGGPRCNAARRRGTRRSLSPAGQDLPERLQAGSGRRAQRYPLRPFSIVSAYPPTAKLSIDGSPARKQTLVGPGGIFKCGIGADGDDDDAASTNSFRSSGVRDLVQRLSSGHWNRRLRPEMGTLGVGS